MATFRTYDRFLYAKVETTEGSAATIDTTDDYIETIEPTFSITNRVYDRNVTRASMTQAPKHVTGTSAAAPSAQCEFSFGVELSGAGVTGVAINTPRYKRLLAACGLQATTCSTVLLNSTQAIAPWNAASFADESSNAWPGDGVDATNSWAPYQFRHGEWISRADLASDSGTPTATYAYATAKKAGRLVGDVWYKDDKMYYLNGNGSGSASTVAIVSGDNLYGQATDTFPGDTTGAAANLAMRTRAAQVDASAVCLTPASDGLVGGGSVVNSLTMRLYLSDEGEYVEMVGARGNCEFVFASGDRCIMQFTFTGALRNYTDTVVAPLPNAQSLSVAPSVVGLTMELAESSYGAANAAYYGGTVFSEFSFNIGNDVTLRDSLSDSTGYEAAYITGRTPTVTFNPDAKRQSTSYDFWDRLLSGETTHMNWTLGTVAGNTFKFKVPGAQFDQIGDGNRDNVMTFDSTVNLTGGNNGSSVMESDQLSQARGGSVTTSTVMNQKLGRNNEFQIIFE